MSRRGLVWAVLGIAVAAALFFSRKGPTPPPAATLASASESAPPASASGFSVRVRGGGAPVADARVALALGDDLVAKGHTAQTGLVTLRPVAPGRLRLVVSHLRFQRYERTLAVEPGGHAEVELVAATVLRAKVEDPAGRAVSGATVRVEAAGRERGRCETAADGRCEIGELAPGALVVHAHSGRHRPGAVELTLEASQAVVDRTLRLEDGRALSGRVVDDSGAPVASAAVGSSDLGGALASSDADGRFELRGLGDAPINVFASAEGFAPRHLRALRPGSANVELRLERPASIEAIVSQDGEAKSLMVSACAFDAHFSEELCVARKLVEPQTTEVVLDGLPSGTFDIVFEAEAHRTERVRARLTSRERTKLGEVRLRASE